MSSIVRNGSKATGARISWSNLLGMKTLVANRLYDAEGNVVGKLEEIVLDVRTGCVRHVVVRGTFRSPPALGAGDRNMTAP